MGSIEHIAIWVENLEKMKDFYVKYFKGEAGGKYINPAKEFSSYFIEFEHGARLEIMTRPDIGRKSSEVDTESGWAHLAFGFGSEVEVSKLTEKLRKDGYTIRSEPRITGDGYFESVICDPEGNLVELTT